MRGAAFNLPGLEVERRIFFKGGTRRFLVKVLYDTSLGPATDSWDVPGIFTCESRKRLRTWYNSLCSAEIYAVSLREGAQTHSGSRKLQRRKKRGAAARSGHDLGVPAMKSKNVLRGAVRRASPRPSKALDATLFAPRRYAEARRLRRPPRTRPGQLSARHGDGPKATPRRGAASPQTHKTLAAAASPHTNRARPSLIHNVRHRNRLTPAGAQV